MIALPAAIVDSHHHLWDLQRIAYPWLGSGYDASKFILGDYQPLCANFLPSDFRSAWGGMPVVASVHIEAECRRDQALAETIWLHEQAASSGLPNAVVAYVDLLAPDADESLSWLQPPILNPTTRLVATANAATGALCVQGWERHGPATRLFTLPRAGMLAA